MTLHQNRELLSDAIRATAQQMGMLPGFVEKDYWVCFALFTIFNDAIGKDIIFKGGTALSKCNKMINRFSEDIDLVVLRKEGETDTKMKAKLKAISNIVEREIPETEVENITRKMGMNRKTAHAYDKLFPGSYAQVRDVIILESSWLGYHEPYTTRTLMSFVGTMMMENGREKIAAEYGLLPFDVSVLEPSRTICEKIMSLVRFSYGEHSIENLKKKIRHTYDLHQLLKQEEFLHFFHSTAFETMLLKVANDDVLSFKNNNSWLENHPKNALLFKELDNVWDNIKSAYSSEFRDLVYGDFPPEREVLKTLEMIQKRLGKLKWIVKIES